MSLLRVIVMDVGWGDCIVIESQDSAGNWHFGLVDCNDTSANQSALNFFKRRLRTEKYVNANSSHLFKFVLLSHDHADHGQGLKGMMREFGTEWFWYPKEGRRTIQTQLMSYARRSKKVQKQQALDNNRILPNLGDATVEVLWPKPGFYTSDQNNNSVILLLTLGDHAFLLSGDAEAEAWKEAAPKIPDNVQFFKVPHHGSRNGSLDRHGQPTWLDHCPDDAVLGISCWAKYGHPHEEVLQLFDNNNRKYLRTDIQYHLIAETDGTNPVKYSYHR
ncbi:MAG: hypothetical protein COB46_08695 [Rhodospirillaceae bacterium]|nr:MAG: hypothetical protein COB46_08695 [Rhodospirillaceae bacterium]